MSSYLTSTHFKDALIADVPPIPVATKEIVPNALAAPAALKQIGYLCVIVIS